MGETSQSHWLFPSNSPLSPQKLDSGSSSPIRKLEQALAAQESDLSAVTGTAPDKEEPIFDIGTKQTMVLLHSVLVRVATADQS